MLLLQLQAELRTRQKATVLELAQALKLQPEIVCDLLAHWLKKGKIQQIEAVGCGEKCFKCPQAWLRQYQWL